MTLSRPKFIWRGFGGGYSKPWWRFDQYRVSRWTSNTTERRRNVAWGPIVMWWPA